MGGVYGLFEARRDFGLGSEYSEVHKVHTFHAVSARVNFVKFVLADCRCLEFSAVAC
jgi:hypothetical protein